MALCVPCREGRHHECSKTVTLEHHRKGFKTGSHQAPCDCADCRLGPNWRGEPAPMPDMGIFKRRK